MQPDTLQLVAGLLGMVIGTVIGLCRASDNLCNSPSVCTGA